MEGVGVSRLIISCKRHKCMTSMCCSYNPSKRSISSQLSIVRRISDRCMSSYSSCLYIGDFNSEISVIAMSEICEIYNLQNLLKCPTFYKNSSRPTCNDPILTNFFKYYNTTKQWRLLYQTFIS